MMNTLVARGRDLVTASAVRNAGSLEHAQAIIREAMPAFIASVLAGADVEQVRRRLLANDDPPSVTRFTSEDWLGATAVFLLVFLSTFPVVIPFLVIRNVEIATRTSNLVAIGLLFAAGYVLARYGGLRPWRTGLAMVTLGVVLVGMTIALGG